MAYDNLDIALKNPAIESCIVCVPHHLHEEYVVKILNLQKHVLLEKPIAHSLASAGKIIQTAKEKKLSSAFMIAEQMDFLPVISNIKKLSLPISYRFNDFSTYYPTGWRTKLEQSGGGVMLDLGIHYVSLAIKLFGPIESHKKTIKCYLDNGEIPSHEQLGLTHKNGIKGQIEVAWRQKFNARKIEVVTDESCFYYRPGSRFAKLGPLPQFVCFRSANGRRQMMQEYLRRCQDSRRGIESEDTLKALAVVL
ncbi:MAG: hypothetical protein A2X86_00065 [Bdellovibrionales bacterium GWA2_49_15]|nr:MAG: hypothetical protein A2X86_00065 [Bdellovibrionales bacterium GWA2_49_15]